MKQLAVIYTIFVLFFASPVFAANRYWVGGTANWDGTAGTKWALTSGGLGGQVVPTSSDDCFFDSQSSTTTPTVTMTASGTCNSIDFTGYTGTFAGSQSLTISGNFTWGSGMTRTFTGNILMNGSTPTSTIKSNGITFGSLINFANTTGGWQLGDNFNSTAQITYTSGSLDTKGFDATTSTFVSAAAGTRKLYLNGSTISCTNTSGSPWNISGVGNFVLSAATSTIRFPNGGASSRTFAGNTLTYNTFSVTGGSDSILLGSTVTLNNILFSNFTGTFNASSTKSLAGTLQLSAGMKFILDAGLTYTIGTLRINGTNGNPITIKSGTDGSTNTLTASSGIFNGDYVNVRDSIAKGGAIFNAGTHGINNGNNRGWQFAPVPFMAHFWFTI